MHPSWKIIRKALNGQKHRPLQLTELPYGRLPRRRLTELEAEAEAETMEMAT